MGDKKKLALALVLLAVLGVVAYRAWSPGGGELAVPEVSALERVSDGVGPASIDEPEQIPSRLPAGAPQSAAEPQEEPAPARSDEAVVTGSLSVDVFFADGTPAARIAVSVALRRPTSLKLESASNRKGRATESRSSDLEGRVLFSELRPGEYLVTTDRGRANAQMVEVASGETASLTLTLGGRDFVVTVVDEREAPIEGAAVLLTPWPWIALAQVGRTDARGMLAVRAAPLACAVGATKSGYSPSPFHLVEENSPLQAILVRLDSPGGALEGCVLGPDGSQVSAARVTVYSSVQDNAYSLRDGLTALPMNAWESSTDSTGCFALDLRPGDMTVSVRSNDPDHAPWRGKCLVVAGSATHLDVQLTRAAQCTGVVRSAAGEPAKRASVEVKSKGALANSVRTDEDGAFALGSIPAGEFVLSARSEDGSSAQVVLFAQPGDSVRQDLELADIQVFRGRVVDSQGEGLPGLNVTCYVKQTGGWANSTVTDENGHFAITEVPDVELLSLTVQKNGAELARQELLLPIAHPVLVTIAKIALGRLEGRIVDSSGAIIGHARIMPVSHASKTAVVHVTELGSGEFAIGDLAEGTYSLIVEANGFERLSTQVEVRGDETVAMGELVMTRRP